jgi:hypothetical protein
MSTDPVLDGLPKGQIVQHYKQQRNPNSRDDYGDTMQIAC